MPFRADIDDSGGQRTFRLAGRLEKEPSAELARLCAEAGVPVRLDLTDLLSADDAGLEALVALRSRGAELVGASPYLALRLETASRQ